MADCTRPTEIIEIEPVLLSSEKAADYLSVAPRTLNISRTRGLLLGLPAPKHLKIGGKWTAYKKSTLDAWIAQIPEYRSSSERRSAASES